MAETLTNGNGVMETLAETLKTSLASIQNQVPWASQAVQLLQNIQDLREQFETKPEAGDNDNEADLGVKLKAMESHVVVDLVRHIVTCTGRAPYYLSRFQDLLEQVEKVSSEGGDQRPDHIAAEMQVAFLEQGFVRVLDVLYETEAALRKLALVETQVSGLESKINLDDQRERDNDHGANLTNLQASTALHAGIAEALTEQNLSQIQSKYEHLGARLAALQQPLLMPHITEDSASLQKYVTLQLELADPSIIQLAPFDPEPIISEHMLHPGTRTWLLERIDRWLTSDKRLFYITGRTGSGKTAMAATVCKLYGRTVVARHFFCKDAGGAACNTVSGLVQGLAADLCRTDPAYLAHILKQVELPVVGDWRAQYAGLIRAPLNALYGSGKNIPANMHRRLLLIDAADECIQGEWSSLQQLLGLLMRDLSAVFCILVTVRSRFSSKLLPVDDFLVEGVGLEDRAFINRHIKDIEQYLGSSLGAVLSGEDQSGTPRHAKADEGTLHSTMDELLKCSTGRFDYAIELMTSFAHEMGRSGQFLGSVKKSTRPLKSTHGHDFDDQMSDFASPFRSYRDREGRGVSVRVLRQSLYPMDKSRVALIRKHHQINQLSKS